MSTLPFTGLLSLGFLIGLVLLVQATSNDATPGDLVAEYNTAGDAWVQNGWRGNSDEYSGGGPKLYFRGGSNVTASYDEGGARRLLAASRERAVARPERRPTLQPASRADRPVAYPSGARVPVRTRAPRQPARPAASPAARRSTRPAARPAARAGAPRPAARPPARAAAAAVPAAPAPKPPSAPKAPKLESWQKKAWIGRDGYRGTHSTSRGITQIYLPMLDDFRQAVHAAGQIADKEEIHVLEVGCGEGVSLAMLQGHYPKFHTECMNKADYKPGFSGMLDTEDPAEVIHMIQNYNIHQANGANLPKNTLLDDGGKAPWPWESQSFDFIVSQATMSKIPDVITALAEAGRVLKPGGYASLSFGTAKHCRGDIPAPPFTGKSIGKTTAYIDYNFDYAGTSDESQYSLTFQQVVYACKTMECTDGMKVRVKFLKWGSQLIVQQEKEDAQGEFTYVSCPEHEFDPQHIVDPKCGYYGPETEYNIRKLQGVINGPYNMFDKAAKGQKVSDRGKWKGKK